ncbi:Hypothetical predicted protein [Paramuricea clavata]|uniref:Uncharacterized protein n=1 Tax=Paramuricea clavata TaxID=317549 RepID=A0A7D9L5K8_PARCT|nr:Hypothetical predicted protein [Paramuricea clavata]
MHLLLWILLSGDIATNPGPGNDHMLRCLSFNAQSIRSTKKLPDGTLIDNMKSEDLVYADNLDLILVTETCLNSNFSNNELLSKGYNIIRNDQMADKRGDDMIDLTTISDLTLTKGEVRYVLQNLDEEKATGPDNIPAVLLKNCAASIAPSLCELFNKSLSSGQLPPEWKLSNVCPIPKKSPLHEVSNYRPISLLLLVSKVFERCIYNRLTDHISSKLNELQHGFQRGKSTTSQLLHVLHNIHKMLEKRCQVDTIYLNFAKAFDKVSHDLLLVKFHNGIKGNHLRWFKNYLSGRFQRLTVHGVTSQPFPILSGIPQGSIFGPILFLINVNDLPIASPKVLPCQCLLMILNVIALSVTPKTEKSYNQILTLLRTGVKTGGWI